MYFADTLFFDAGSAPALAVIHHHQSLILRIYISLRAVKAGNEIIDISEIPGMHSRDRN